MATSPSTGDAQGKATSLTSTGDAQGKATSLKPGDEAAAGTPGTGEDLCEECSGTGKLGDGTQCPNCSGTGRVVRAIGGG